MVNYREFPRQPLGFFPTPIVELKRLSNFLDGPRILMKRDDQTGLAFGGNKTRKLEFLVSDALSKGADTLITGGAAQSNHCRQTAAAAAICNLECHLALSGTPPQLANGNLLLDQLLGAKIHWSGELRKGESIPHIYEALKEVGRAPYIVPYGGSNRIGASAFVEAIREMTTQLASETEKVTHVVFASSSGGMHAGLMVGKQVFDQAFHVIGVNIDKETTDQKPFGEYILSLANDTAEHLGVAFRYSNNDLLLRSEYVGEGYGVVGELEREAIALVATYEGILLDPIYTGRAMGGLLDMIRNKELTKRDTVLFWHTGGGPALFAYADELIA